MRCTSEITDAPELRKVEGTDHILATDVPDGVHQLHELQHFLLRPLTQTTAFSATALSRTLA